MKKLFLYHKHDLDFWVYFAILVFSFFALPLLSRNAGMSGDEPMHMSQAENVLRFYQTLGKDTLAVTPTGRDENLHQYGQLADNISLLIAKMLPIEDILWVRHTVNALFGWLGILFASLLAYRIRKKWLAAIMTAVLLFFSPLYLGHSFNNLKDIPFAATMMMGIYFIFRFLQTFPNPSKKICIMLSVSIGLAIGVRVGGLLLIAFFGLFALCYLINERHNQKKQEAKKIKNEGEEANKISAPFPIKLWGKMLLYGLAIVVGGYVLGVLLWPFAIVSPIKNVQFAYAEMSQFGLFMQQVFEGHILWSDLLPWYYTPKYILITSPIAVIIGAIVYLTMGGLKKENRWATFVVYFSFIFPIFWIAYTGANVYGGWRHSLFVYPPMVVAAGLGFCALTDMVKNKYAKIMLTALPFLLLLNPIIFTIKNHPYEYVYFNRFVGGIKGAYGNYEMDYYYHSCRELSEWVQHDVQQNGTPDNTRKIRVATWAPEIVKYFFRKDTADFSIEFTRWKERGYSDWDYAIFTITGMYPELLRNKKAFPPQNTVYQVKVDGVPIGIVLKREDRNDYYGHLAMQNEQTSEAIDYLKKALKHDDHNEQALNDLITIYKDRQNVDSALLLAKHWTSFNRGNPSAFNHLATLYIANDDLKNALRAAHTITQLNIRDISGLWLAANIYVEQGKPNDALQCLYKLLHVRKNFKPAYGLMAQIYEEAGYKENAKQMIDIMNRIP
ncbi:hypothetical protein AGMMS4956_09140 [Bacteroidia bacterium]|nr:hypothetical protein AGMMS4956_09140 [Bacteroidia bacterium]